MSEIIKQYRLGRTLPSLAKEYGCSTDKIRWCLVKNKVLEKRKENKCNLPEQEIVELYKQDILKEEIAKRYNVSVGPICSILKKYKVRKPNWLKILPYKTIELVLDKEKFQQLVDECISQQNIIKKLSCGQSMVVSLCKYHNIEMPNSAEVRSLQNQQSAKHLFTKESVENLYINQHIPKYKVAKLVGVGRKLLDEKLVEWNIQTRSAGESRISKEFYQVKNDKEVLQTLYNENSSLQILKHHLNVNSCTLIKTLNEHAIERINLGCEYGRFRNNIVEKRKQTNFERYGTGCPFQSKEIQEKVKQTMLNRYGVEHPLQSKEIQEKSRQTNLERYGVKHPTQKQIVNFLPLLKDHNWLYNEYISRKKTARQIANELGGNKNLTTICNYLHRHDIEIRYKHKYSYKCIEWLKTIIKNENIFIQHAGNIGEHRIPGTRFFADGYCEETNTIYEFYGSVWHGDLNIFQEDERRHPFLDITVGESYYNTKRREKIIREIGYNLITIWESDWDLRDANASLKCANNRLTTSNSQ
ncbi:MAG: DUF7487 domain-containing protein [Nitrosopumilaceae archaeon]